MDVRSLATALELGHDGIWYGAGTRDVSYPEDGNAHCFEVEDRSFWFRHRNACIASVVREFPPSDGRTVVDVGGGNGFVAAGLSAAGFDVAVVEPGITGAANAKARGVSCVICATVDAAGFRRHSLPAVGLFDVIEHIERDTQFLVGLRELLVPEGRIYATVPAYPLLWSEEDELAGHFRRHTRSSISSLFASAGFTVEFSSYFFRVLPLPILFLRALPYRLGITRRGTGPDHASRDHGTHGGVLSRLLDATLRPELGHLDHRKPMRFGASCIVVARPASR